MLAAKASNSGAHLWRLDLKALKRTLAAAVTATLLQHPAASPRAQEAAPDTATQITHLLDFVRTSLCAFVRNGTAYDGAEAVVHIRKKYDYFKDKITTADDFIDLAATKSEMSGQPYMVRCPEQEAAPAAAWLRTELQHYLGQKLSSAN